MRGLWRPQTRSKRPPDAPGRHFWSPPHPTASVATHELFGTLLPSPPPSPAPDALMRRVSWGAGGHCPPPVNRAVPPTPRARCTPAFVAGRHRGIPASRRPPQTRRLMRPWPTQRPLNVGQAQLSSFRPHAGMGPEAQLQQILLLRLALGGALAQGTSGENTHTDMHWITGEEGGGGR